jgi:hypothetical protein
MVEISLDHYLQAIQTLLQLLSQNVDSVVDQDVDDNEDIDDYDHDNREGLSYVPHLLRELKWTHGSSTSTTRDTEIHLRIFKEH